MNKDTAVTTCQYIGPTEHTEHVRLQPTCCKPVVLGKSYCADHVWQIYQEGTAVRRKKDARRAQAVWDIESAMNEAIEELVEEGFLDL